MLPRGFLSSPLWVFWVLLHGGSHHTDQRKVNIPWVCPYAATSLQKPRSAPTRHLSILVNLCRGRVREEHPYSPEERHHPRLGPPSKTRPRARPAVGSPPWVGGPGPDPETRRYHQAAGGHQRIDSGSTSGAESQGHAWVKGGCKNIKNKTAGATCVAVVAEQRLT